MQSSIHDQKNYRSLNEVREWVKRNINGVRETYDRRGFLLLQWDPRRPNDANKPCELSLEHEARLMPDNLDDFLSLQERLYASEGKTAGEVLLPKQSPFSNFMVKRYQRQPGAQSIDRYYDHSDRKDSSIIPQMITVRERVASRKFMTWGSADAVMHPLNLELPFVALGDTGMTVRLEFNWIDEIEKCTNEAVSSDCSDKVKSLNPFYIASTHTNISFKSISPVIEHTTFREKFGLFSAGDSAEVDERFVINLDHVTAQCLETGRIGGYIDVDISGVTPINEKILDENVCFTKQITDAYKLIPNMATKVFRDAQVTGRFDELP